MSFFSTFFDLPSGNIGEAAVHCPFPHHTASGHVYKEQHPSAHVNIQKGLFNCKACGAGYSETAFISQFLGTSYSNAVRLQKAFNANPLAKKSYDFKFVIDDQATYYQLEDFHSPQAKALFGKYSQLQKSYKEQSEKLEEMRSKYARSNTDEKTKMSAAILDLEKRIQQLSEEVEQTAIQIRNLEKQTIK